MGPGSDSALQQRPPGREPLGVSTAAPSKFADLGQVRQRWGCSFCQHPPIPPPPASAVTAEACVLPLWPLSPERFCSEVRSFSPVRAVLTWLPLSSRAIYSLVIRRSQAGRLSDGGAGTANEARGGAESGSGRTGSWLCSTGARLLERREASPSLTHWPCLLAFEPLTCFA